MTRFAVTLTHQFPAWDEKAGYTYEVLAGSKSEAIAIARREAGNDGHLITGKGRPTFRAVELEALAPLEPEAPVLDVEPILQAHPQIGRLNSGRFYVFPVGGEYREAADPRDLI